MQIRLDFQSIYLDYQVFYVNLYILYVCKMDSMINNISVNNAITINAKEQMC